MLKLVKSCFLCLCGYAAICKNRAYIKRTNRIYINRFLFLYNKPLRNFHFAEHKLEINNLFQGIKTKELYNREVDCRRKKENGKIKIQLKKKRSIEHSDENAKGKKDIQDIKDKSNIYMEDEKKKTVSKKENDDISVLNNKKCEKNAPKKNFVNEATRKKMSELAKKRWNNEEERKKLLQSKRKFRHTEETKKLLSYKIKLKWKDENYRKRIIEKSRIFNQDENTKKRKSLLLKEKWKMKEFRDKMLSKRRPFSMERRKKISEIIKKKWKTEDYKRKTLTAIQENYKKRKLQAGLDPNLNYLQNVSLFKKLGMNPPKMRIFPDTHIKKLRLKKRKKKEKSGSDSTGYKENWKHIYDSIVNKNGDTNAFPYLNRIDNFSISGYF